MYENVRSHSGQFFLTYGFVSRPKLQHSWQNASGFKLHIGNSQQGFTRHIKT